MSSRDTLIATIATLLAVVTLAVLGHEQLAIGVAAGVGVHQAVAATSAIVRSNRGG